MFVRCGSGLGGEYGAVTSSNGGDGSGLEEQTGRGASMFGNDGGAFVPAGVSDIEGKVVGNETVTDVVSKFIMGVITYEREVNTTIPPAKMFEALAIDGNDIVAMFFPQAIKNIVNLDGDPI
ncbi:hypothetical protein POTOM_035199 [Populus tomentosa]|uniref:Uncharacterized protein n=1 Tax=Populus tomentosa TaxID=118781 RepID=A0A8X7YZT1_POPTO|nr:hypothetical protein POTOM_035199 [Populus tomentosa]